MPTIVNGKLTYASGEAMPAMGSAAYVAAQKGQLPPAPMAPVAPAPTSAPAATPAVPTGYWTEGKIVNGINTGGGTYVNGTPPASAITQPPIPNNTDPSTGTPTPINSGTNTNGSTATNGSVFNDPTANSNAMLQKVLGLMTPTTAETDLQSKLADLEATRVTTQRGIESQPIATSFMGGQTTELNKNINASEGAISPQLSALQVQRNAALDAAKTGFEASKPVTVGLGTNLVSPLTGQTVAEGQSYAGKQGSANVLALSKAYPDAGILPSDDPSVAAQKASNAPSFIAKYGKVNYQWNPSTGQFEMLSTNRLGATTPSNIGTAGGMGTSTSSSNFGTSGSISAGSSGASVSALQNFLISKGYSIPAGATGYYGDQTAAAVAKFQADNGINTAGGGAGVFGPQTASAASSKGFSLSGTMTSAGGQNGGAGGSTASTGNPFGLNPSNKIDGAALSYIQTGEMPSGLYPADQTAVRARAQQVSPGFNPAIAKANAGAIGEQTKILANVSSSINTADANFKLLMDTAKRAGINDNSSPIINGLQNALQKNYIGSGDLNQFTTGIQTLRTEYAQVLARGGIVTEGVRNEANSLIPDNISLDNLQKVYDYIKREGQNVIDERKKTIHDLSTGGSSSNMGTSGNPATSADYQAYLKAIGQ